MKKTLLFINILLVVCFVFTLNAFTQTETIELTLGTSSPGGSWYPATLVMAKIIQEEIPNVRVTVMPGGSVGNVKGTSKGIYDLALAHTQDIANGIAGEGAFEEKITNLYGLMNLWTNYVMVAVSKDSNIESIPDLKGKRICPGQLGWGGEASTRFVLSLYDMTYDDMSKVDYTGWTGMVDLWKDRHIDAAVACSTLGLSSFQEMAVGGSGIRILPISDEAIEEGVKLNPGYFANVLPAGSFRGQDQEVPVFSSTTILFSHNELPDDLARNIIKHLLNRRDELVAALSAFKELNPEFGAKIPGVPIHPGASAYYKEIGVLK